MISIIVANHNRAHIITETLESIQSQTYSHFECLIIDDHSTDNSDSIIQKWIKQDDRFQYYRRPNTIKKGANACRNWGFKQSKGELIKFFDSDDIMLPNHLEVSIEYLQKQKLDFVVLDCQNFDKNGLRERPYETNKDHVKISPFEFAKFQNAWITNDLMLTREYAEQIEFNENIRDLASEYQYAIKLLLLTQNGIVLPHILTHRRVHEGSFVVNMEQNETMKMIYIAETKLFTAIYLSDIAPKSLIRWFLEGHMQYCFELITKKINPGHLCRASKMYFEIFGFFKTALLYSGFLSGYLFKKGYSVVKMVRQSE